MGSLNANAAQALGHTCKEISRSRAAVLSYLVKLNRCVDAQHRDLVVSLSRRFSETLIDYISYGHFRLMGHLSPEPHQQAALDNMTHLSLRFDEKYNGTHQRISLTELKADLEQIALAMEARFEIEDEVVQLAVA